MKTEIFLLVAILTCLVLLGGCSERAANNPFDPNFSEALLDVSLEPESTFLTLRWQLNRTINDVRNFRIYRAVDTPDSFTVYRDLDPATSVYIDTTVDQNRWYYYRMSVLGPSSESRLSPILRTYLGQGNYWVIAPDDFQIYSISYDLLHIKSRFETAFRPATVTTSAADGSIWIGYGQFIKAIGQFDKLQGNEVIRQYDAIDNPVAILSDPGRNQIVLLDNAGNQLLFIDEDNLLIERDLQFPGNYIEMAFSDNNNYLLLLAEDQIVRVRNSATINEQQSLSFGAESIARDLFSDAGIGPAIYIITNTVAGSQSMIYQLSTGFAYEDSLLLNSDIYLGTGDAQNQRLYLAEMNPGGDDRIVQLSLDGSRQLELPVGFGQIADLQVNPFDQSLLVVDKPGNLIYLFDSQGRLVSESRDNNGQRFLFQPSKIFVE